MRSRGLTLVDVVVVASIFLVIACFVVVAAEGAAYAKRGGAPTKCLNNLKQIALAAVAYNDDHHFFPHVGPREELDGGYKSNTATRVLRALTYFDYDDNPEGFVCPNSVDEPRPLSPAVRADIRAFRWEGADGPPARVSPLAPDGADAHDVPLDRSTELSYGWTRKSYSSNSSSSALLAADKSIGSFDASSGDPAYKDHMVGNHNRFMNAVCVDAHTLRITPLSSPIDSIKISVPGPGYLGVLGDDSSWGK